VIVVLAGGTGGAKLARGMADVVGQDELVVVANHGDDVEVHGVHVSPDPDLVTLWLADLIDERGWGVRDDSWRVMEALDAVSRPVWFRLGDRDLAHCLVRTELLHGGRRATEAQAELVRGLGVRARVLPPSDEPVRTRVRARGRWRPFQEFMIVDHAEGPIEDVELHGAERARPTPEVLAALAEAEAIVVGPSNPVISIGPILAVPGLREAVVASRAPVVAVSPFVDGGVLKGPTEPFCHWAGIGLDADGVARHYAELIDGVVADEPSAGDVPLLHTDTRMDSPATRRRVADETLTFARGLGESPDRR
jgi:LPPG:FO 2-phospho-L-lactate transferase